MQFVPCLILVILTLMILSKLAESKRRKASLTGVETDQSSASVASEKISSNLYSSTKSKLSMRSSKNSGSSMRKKQKKESADQTANALLAIVILFLICELPVSFILFAATFDTRLIYIILIKVKYFTFMLRLLNASLNFVLYCFMSGLFRDTFSEIFGDYLKTPHWWRKSGAIEVEQSDTSKRTQSLELA